MDKKFRNIIFDLDGTLTNPTEGILNSLRFALKKMGYPNLPDSLPNKFIGPPLQQGFSEVYGMNKKQTDLAVLFFREYYGEFGLFENEPFQGIHELMESLNNSGYSLFVATSKLEKFAWQIIKHFEFDKYIKDIAGAEYNGNHSKQQLIEELIDRYRLIKTETLMVGDTNFDLIGAKDAGIDSVGLTYGFGQRCDLQKLNPLYLADSPEELMDFFL
jgi:phosphoglycolate phosphatase